MKSTLKNVFMTVLNCTAKFNVEAKAIGYAVGTLFQKKIPVDSAI
jgi:hypothetical protein